MARCPVVICAPSMNFCGRFRPMTTPANGVIEGPRHASASHGRRCARAWTRAASGASRCDGIPTPVDHFRPPAPAPPAARRVWPPAAHACGMAPDLGPHTARDMPKCGLVACGVLAWARPARPCGCDTRMWEPRGQGRSWALPAPEHLRSAVSPLTRVQAHLVRCRSRRGACRRSFAAARTPGHADHSMRSKDVSWSAGEEPDRWATITISGQNLPAK